MHNILIIYEIIGLLLGLFNDACEIFSDPPLLQSDVALHGREVFHRPILFSPYENSDENYTMLGNINVRVLCTLRRVHYFVNVSKCSPENFSD